MPRLSDYIFDRPSKEKIKKDKAEKKRAKTSAQKYIDAADYIEKTPKKKKATKGKTGSSRDDW